VNFVVVSDGNIIGFLVKYETFPTLVVALVVDVVIAVETVVFGLVMILSGIPPINVVDDPLVIDVSTSRFTDGSSSV
jgi:hypothetical protein